MTVVHYFPMIVQPLKATTTKPLIFSMLTHRVSVRISSLSPAQYYHIYIYVYLISLSLPFGFLWFKFTVLRKLASLTNLLVYRKVQISHKMLSLLRSWWFTNCTRLSGPTGLQVQGKWLYFRSIFECTLNKLEQVSLAGKFLLLWGAFISSQLQQCTKQMTIGADTCRLLVLSFCCHLSLWLKVKCKPGISGHVLFFRLIQI